MDNPSEFLEFFTLIMSAILTTLPFVILIYILLKLPRTIDVVYDDSNKQVLFKVFSKRGSFLVYDYTRTRRMKIIFKTYVDVEAFINRRVNGWQNIHNLRSNM